MNQALLSLHERWSDENMLNSLFNNNFNGIVCLISSGLLLKEKRGNLVIFISSIMLKTT